MAHTRLDNPVYGYWHYDKLDPAGYARADLFCRTQALASFSGTFLRGADYEPEVSMGVLHVAENLRQSGIGTKLLEALACLAIEDDITTIGGNVVSPRMIRMLTKLARSEEGITFYDRTPQGDLVELPLTSAQACLNLSHAEKLEPDPTKRRHGIDVAVGLSPGQRFGLEAPIMLNSPSHAKPAYRLV